jgi:hypothetical protein
MTPSSAAKSNAAAREAGWYASTWHHAQISEAARGRSGPQEWRKRITDLLAKHEALTTGQIRTKLCVCRDTTKARLKLMENEGRITQTPVLIDGKRQSLWRLAE